MISHDGDQSIIVKYVSKNKISFQLIYSGFIDHTHISCNHPLSLTYLAFTSTALTISTDTPTTFKSEEPNPNFKSMCYVITATFKKAP